MKRRLHTYVLRSTESKAALPRARCLVERIRDTLALHSAREGLVCMSYFQTALPRALALEDEMSAAPSVIQTECLEVG